MGRLRSLFNLVTLPVSPPLPVPPVTAGVTVVPSSLEVQVLIPNIGPPHRLLGYPSTGEVWPEAIGMRCDQGKPGPSWTTLL